MVTLIVFNSSFLLMYWKTALLGKYPSTPVRLLRPRIQPGVSAFSRWWSPTTSMTSLAARSGRSLVEGTSPDEDEPWVVRSAVGYRTTYISWPSIFDGAERADLGSFRGVTTDAERQSEFISPNNNNWIQTSRRRPQRWCSAPSDSNKSPGKRRISMPASHGEWFSRFEAALSNGQRCRRFETMKHHQYNRRKSTSRKESDICTLPGVAKSFVSTLAASHNT